MKKQKIQFAIFMLLLAVTACDNADYSKSAPFDNGVYLSVAESKTVKPESCIVCHSYIDKLRYNRAYERCDAIQLAYRQKHIKRCLFVFIV